MLSAGAGCQALRLFPTLSRLMRLAESETELGGFKIPAGAVLRLSILGMQRSTAVWGDDAMEFKPERFMDEKFLATWAVGGRNIPGGREYGFLPFGAGQRSCMGKRLALVEATAAIARVLDTWRLSPAPGHPPVEAVSDITMGPKKGLHLLLRRRRAE
jgi:cytochrome P450